MTAVAELDRQMGILLSVPLAAVRESRTNPRHHFHPGHMKELVDSIREVGVLNPILVRELRADEFEVVDGARRFRAAQQAGMAEVPVLVLELTDRQALEMQVIANLQRDNLHPMEEAEGFRALMEQAGYDIAKLASRVGRDRSYVYDRLKLLQLVPAAQELFLQHRFELGHAVLLARLSPADQERALEGHHNSQGRIRGLFVSEAFGLFEEDGEDEAAGEGSLIESFDRTGLKPVSVREFKRWIDESVRFRPDNEDLTNLFPQTEQALQTAAEEKLKVVMITREYRVPDEARDPKERTYGANSWKRADGQSELDWDTRKPTPAKVCEHQVMGVVVAGFGRGEAFHVCIAKKKCEVHWAREMREAAKRAKEAANTPAAPGQRTAAAKEISPPDELVRSWLAEEFSAEAERLLPKAMATLKDFLILPDDVAWNLARALRQGDGVGPWAAVGKRADPWFGGRYIEDVAEVLQPQLPGKWDPKDTWNPQRDAEAARSSLALAITVSRDFGDKGCKALDARLMARRRKWDAEQAKGAAKSQGVQQKAAPKGKAKKKHAGDVRRAKAKGKAAVTS